MPNCSVGPSKCEMKFSYKINWYGLCENAWFPWQPPYMILEVGGRPANSVISRVLFKIDVKLKLRHMSFILWSDL